MMDEDNSSRLPPSPPPKGGGLGLGMTIAGFVLGILSLLLSFVPCVGALALWPGVVACLLSLVGLLNSAAKGLPIAALVISLGSVGFALYQRQQIVEVGTELNKEGQKVLNELEKAALKEKERMEKEAKKNKVID